MTGRHSSGPAVVHLLDRPHHDGSSLYVSTRSPAPGSTVTLRVRVPHAHRAAQVVLRAVRDGEPALVPATVQREDAHETWWGVELQLHNPVTSYRFFLQGAAGSPVPYGWLNATGLHGRDVPDAADFVLSTYASAPEWVEDAVVYQVFPDRFARSSSSPPVDAEGVAPAWAVPAAWDEPVLPRDQDGRQVARQWFGGDLDGVVERLDHLVDLGVTCLYLTPVFEGRSNHRYDASSFDHVDPALGGTDALVRLTAAAHERGLRVIGDLTTNHTGVGHEWFRAAQEDPQAPSAAYYRFREHPHDYVSWLDVPSLPKLDHSSDALREALYRGRGSVVGRWLYDPVALDGWRIDVANMTGRYADADDTHSVARDLRTTMREADAETGRETWLLAEHGHDAGADLVGDGWHGTMNYTGFTRPVWTWLRPDPAPAASAEIERITFLGLPIEVPRLAGRATARTMDDFRSGMPWRAWQASSTQLDSHDTARVRTVLGGGEGYPADGGPSGAAPRGRGRGAGACPAPRGARPAHDAAGGAHGVRRRRDRPHRGQRRALPDALPVGRPAELGRRHPRGLPDLDRAAARARRAAARRVPLGRRPGRRPHLPARARGGVRAGARRPRRPSADRDRRLGTRSPLAPSPCGGRRGEAE